MKKITLILLFIITVLNPSFGQKDKSDFKVVGYYSLRSAMNDDYKEFPFDKVTHVNLYFLNPDTLGVYNQDFSTLEPFINEAHKNGVKVLFSIAGGGAHPYYHRLLRDDMRGTIVKSLVDLVIKYNLDGLDNDLEHGDIGENYEDFNVELRAALKAHNKLLTAAVVVTNPDLFSDRSLAQFDFVNVMSYDHTGPWRPNRPGQHASMQHFKDDFEHFRIKRGIAAKEINMGVPFYGYIFGPELTSRASSMNYNQIIERYPNAELVDELAIEDGRMLYYNGIETIKQKTRFAKENAGGIMIWQL
jgi:GH18 family chitinase